MITLFVYNKETGADRPSLVVCPASLVYNWEEEIHRFAPSLKAQVAAGTLGKRKEALSGKPDVFITSYDLLKRDLKLYENRQFHVCVIDEAQYIKNGSAAQTKAVKVIQADHRFALTGTPIENRLSELWSIFDFLMPGLLYSNKEFVKQFEGPIVKEKDQNAAEKLRGLTGPFILRRRKEEVLKDLPEKLEEVRYARMEGVQQKVYDAEAAHMKRMLETDLTAEDSAEKGRDKIRILAELTKIRQLCCDPSLALEDYTGESAKRDACLNLIRTAMEEGHRMLVFSQFTSMLALLEADLQKEGISYYKIIGETPKEKRMELVKAFNNNDVPVFLISLRAGGTGLNLTGADVVIHYDPWWNVAAQNQATDRVHRIGQTRKVMVFRLIMKDTIEEKILNLQSVKQDLANAIIEGDHTSLTRMSAEELLALLG
jgi:SNF2 family DNA or RNA helicase